MKRKKQTERHYKSDPKGYRRFICCEQDCQEGVARNLDGTTEGNYRCDKHTYVYYAPVFDKHGLMV